ncbi:MAG: hypothetical protein MUO35_03040, partial [Anaerolineales bacterium]|nr:hypothetical protein [Anaerolineales bacterium]
SLPLSRIGDWPTHDRFRRAGAGRVALTERDLRSAVDDYLTNPDSVRAARHAFLEREITYTDASAGRRTGEYLLHLLERGA